MQTIGLLRFIFLGKHLYSFFTYSNFPLESKEKVSAIRSLRQLSSVFHILNEKKEVNGSIAARPLHDIVNDDVSFWTESK